MGRSQMATTNKYKKGAQSFQPYQSNQPNYDRFYNHSNNFIQPQSRQYINNFQINLERPRANNYDNKTILPIKQLL